MKLSEFPESLRREISDDVLFQGKELVIALAQALMWVRSKAEVKDESNFKRKRT
jgi:hypothetical protein